MPIILPSTAVVRVSRGNFKPSRFPEVEKMARDTGEYLIPAIRGLSGVLGYFVAASPSGSMVHVSLWESEEKAQQMAQLREMVVNARQAAEAAGVSFIPIVNYPIKWNL